jgi:DNA-binding NarL/FixJ family response regulator
MTIRIVLADDHQIVRLGVRSLLEVEPDLKVVGEAENGEDALGLVTELCPDVVIMDISMPDVNGIEATRRILAQFPQTKVIALSMHSDSLFVMNMLKAGASGYLLKDCALEELVKAIRTVLREKTYLSVSISNLIIRDLSSTSSGSLSAYAVLTTREREVLQMITSGKNTNQIAEELTISVKTVEAHRKQLMTKLGLKSIAELTKYAIQQGLTTL